jgi:phosphoenolpyruvate carboxykinase (ATP)
MPSIDEPERRIGLDQHGLRNVGEVFWNLPTPALYEQIVRRREGLVAHLGSIVVRTGQHTGRAPNDKFIVGEPTSKGEIWWGNFNRPCGLTGRPRIPAPFSP